MDQAIKKLLDQPEVPSNIKDIFDRLQANLSRSRGIMGKEYPRWKRNISVYKGEMPKTEGDLEASEEDEPERFVVPLTFAQVQTCVAFWFLLMTQNRNFYEFEQIGDEDRNVKDLAELLLQGELNENQWLSKFYQSLLDAARLGITITKETWTRSTVWLPGNEADIQNVNGTNLFDIIDNGDREVVSFEGNTINNISPFKFFPDPNLPLVRWREGTWVADEEEYTISYIRQVERKGLITGVKHLTRMHDQAWQKRSSFNSFEMLYSEQVGRKHTDTDDDYVVILAEHYVWLNPSKYGIGDQDYELLYLVRIANDQRIVSIERYGYLHNSFPHNVGIVSPDTCINLSASLADTIHSIQDVVTYLINSRVMGLRKNLGRNLIVDPTVIDVASLANNNDIITTMPGAPKNGIEKFAHQLQYRDNTATNLNDASELQRLLLMVTGVNENAMGQVSSGRRSATENRAANGGAASKMRMTGMLLWDSCYGPQGKKQLCNLRYGLSFEMFKKYVGDRPNLEELYEQFSPSDISKLIGSRDVFMFESTMPSEKGFLAQSMQELLIAIISNPNLAQQYDTEQLMEEIYSLRGIQTRRFKLSPQRPPMVPPGGLDQGTGIAPVIPTA
jgi:hypothetical protein